MRRSILTNYFSKKLKKTNMDQKLKTGLLLLIATLTFAQCTQKNSKEYDTRAIKELDILSETIGKLNSCSYTIEVNKHEKSSDDNWQSVTTKHDVYMRGPSKLYIHTNIESDNKGYWYNGNQLAYYSYSQNIYDTVSISGNIIEAIDFIHKKFDIDFPAADFFYPTFTDDIINNNDKVYFVGEEKIEESICFLIQASNKKELINIWIDVSTNLPHKLEIFSNNNRSVYEAQFLNWKINPNLPDEIFNFTPPSNSKKVALTPKN